MINLLNILSKTKFYNNLKKAIEDDERNIIMDNVSAVHSSFMASLLCENLNKNVVVVASDEMTGEKIVKDINTVLNKDKAVLFKSREMIFRSIDASSGEYEYHRLNTLYNLLRFKAEDKAPKIIVAPIESLQQRIIDPEKYKDFVINLKIGQNIKIEKLSEKLVSMGYIKSFQVDGVGQFSVRGEIVDIFPPNLKNPVRIDFWDDEIDNIFLFDQVSQRKIDERLEEVFISPVTEILFDDIDKLTKKIRLLKDKISNKKVQENIDLDIEKLRNGVIPDNIDKYAPLIFEKKSLIIDYLDDPVILMSDYDAIIRVSQGLLWSYSREIEGLIEDNILSKEFGSHILLLEEIENKLKDHTVIYTSVFDNIGRNKEEYKIVHCFQKELSPWNGDISLLEKDIKYYKENNFKIIVLAGGFKLAEDLIKDLRLRSFVVSDDVSDINNHEVIISDEVLSSGVEYAIDKIVVITIDKNFNKKKRIVRHRRAAGEIAINSLEDIDIGDYVVHVNHGVGIFDGINKLELDGVIQDYIKIKYSGSDVLYVPVTQLDLVSKYIGNKEDRVLKLNKLSSLDWQKRKYNVKKAVKDIAKDLIKLQSERLSVKGFAFSEDTDWQRQFEDKFPFKETQAQLRSIEEIKRDMESPHPMDRLLCGDVGVGKTEVAVRVAFKAVMDSKQVAILTPTTILSWQHYNTIVSRLEDFPIKVEILSRLKTQKEQKEIVKKLKSGEIEIIIGTHRLLQKDVEFKDLGLVIIDEEQRFGVTDKEKLKQIKHNVDVLTLSATPIPRTLNMAMSGVKDMSVIDETPQDRLPIQTYVLEYDDFIIASAIMKEMKRGGMVFYLHNRVETIDQVAAKISKLVPSVRVCVAHGKMLQSELTKIWERLLNHEADVLVCTTIIETGIDIPFCNTLIVENSDQMGLSQLHQLRGRIGRSNKKAFAYMTFRKGKDLSEISVKRLTAIKEFTKFGAGFKIAMRDLEIRGAGDLLGAQQHGHIDCVGYDMYIKLLSEAISEEKGEAPDLLVSEKCVIDLKVTAYLPEKYIQNVSNRIDIYKKIAMIKTKEDYNDMLDELIDRFGDPPSEVTALLNISWFRNIAIKMNIKEISEKNDYIYIYQEPVDLKLAGKISERYKARAVINFESQPSIKIRKDNKENSQSLIEFLSVL